MKKYKEIFDRKIGYGVVSRVMNWEMEMMFEWKFK